MVEAADDSTTQSSISFGNHNPAFSPAILVRLGLHHSAGGAQIPQAGSKAAIVKGYLISHSRDIGPLTHSPKSGDRLTLASLLWQQNQDLAAACLNSAFVQGIGDGSLARAKFAYYVGQDAFFLEGFARAYSVCAAKAPDWPTTRLFHDLAGGVLEEMKLHQDYTNQWNIDLVQVTPGVATRRYVDFLLATAWSQPIGLTTVAMAPCMRLYCWLGQQLAQDGLPEHTYTAWINTYSDPSFDQLAAQLEQLVERYADESPETTAAYRYAMQCELDFFQAAWDPPIA
jgi:thiaminase/transcriptional activator TenA